MGVEDGKLVVRFAQRLLGRVVLAARELHVEDDGESAARCLHSTLPASSSRTPHCFHAYRASMLSPTVRLLRHYSHFALSMRLLKINMSPF